MHWFRHSSAGLRAAATIMRQFRITADSATRPRIDKIRRHTPGLRSAFVQAEWTDHVANLPPISNLNRRHLLCATPALITAAGGIARAQVPGAVAPPAAKLIAAAQAQIGVTTRYNPAYERLSFPGGDVPMERGVCTDVVVRAYRVAFAADLQALIHADMKAAFSVYPRNWGLTVPDTNIDHRRVLNMQVFFRRKGAALPVPTNTNDWQPGDLVTQTLPNGRPHIGIVSDKRHPESGRLLVIHNIGGGTEASDILALFKPVGRYRYLV
jgi:uncharacterized protein